MKLKNFNKNVLLIVGVMACFSLSAQVNYKKGGINTVNSAVPFLRIVPDARGGAMGDVGIATSVDPNTSYYNASKLVFAKRKLGLSLSYAPWLRALGITDIYLAHFSMYYKVSRNDVVHTSLKFFSLGQIDYTDIDGNSLGTGRPNELTVDAGYSRRLGKGIGLGVAFRYIYSNLAKGQTTPGSSEIIRAGHAFGADVSFTYTKDLKMKNEKMKSNIMVGAAVTNIGTKISYLKSSKEKDYIPTNFGAGIGYRIQPNKYHEVGVYADFNKLLVPTPDTIDNNNDGIADFKQYSSMKGMFKSIGDAPGGFKEEMREWTMGIGAEYWYDHIFAVRAGYFLEAKDKGNRKFVSMGVGVKYSVFGLDFSYLIPTGGAARNPLDNTFRFSLKFDFAKVGGNQPEDDSYDINYKTDEVDKATRKKLRKQKGGSGTTAP